MRKIGILTIHRIYNHGSFLQAFSVKSTIEDILADGTMCEFIDWPLKDKSVTPSYNIPKNTYRKPFGFRFWIHKLLGHTIYCRDTELIWLYNQLGKVYVQQCQKYLGVSSIPNYNTNYDAIVVGSDESFNCTQDDANWDGLFCFKLSQCSRVFSYAASFGYSDLTRLEKYNVTQIVKKGLNSYISISVRDKNSQVITDQLTDLKSSINLDPVLIYDYSKYIPKININCEFILVYNYLNRINEVEFISSIKKYARERNLKIISVFEYCSWADKNIVLNSFEVLAYFIKAKYVITDTFHGAVLSIKFNKQFASFVRPSNFNKLHFLLERFGLENRIVSQTNDFKKILSTPVNWDVINHEIEKERIKTVNYFKKNLIFQ
jgi:hypothetical protein